MMEITDEYMKEMRQKTKPYVIMILHKTKRVNGPGVDKIIWNMEEETMHSVGKVDY